MAEAERAFTPDQMAQMFLDYGNNMLRALMAGGKAAVLKMATDTVERELSFPKSGPPVFPGLRWQTGHLRRSVAASPDVRALSEKEAEASFGTSVPYGVMFEEGGDFTVPAHTRRIASRNLFIRESGKRRKSAQGVAFIRAHVRHLEARRYLGRTLESDKEVTYRLVDRSLWMLFQTGKAPDAGAVGEGVA